MLFLPLVGGQHEPTSDIKDVRFRKLIFSEDEAVSFDILGYISGMEDRRTTVRISILEGGTYRRWDVETREISGKNYFPENIGKLPLGNRSRNTFAVIVDFDFPDGFHWTESTNIEIVKKPVHYSAEWSDDGRSFSFYSSGNFSVTFVYSFGAMEQNSTIFREVHGHNLFRVPDCKGLTSCDVYIEDQWGNVNSDISTDGQVIPYHYFYFESGPGFWLTAGYVFLMVFAMFVCGFLAYLLKRRRERE